MSMGNNLRTENARLPQKLTFPSALR